jgi:hypothetical protein
MTKPKKALRGLFARTEPTPAEDVASHRSLKKALGIRETTPKATENEEEAVQRAVAAPAFIEPEVTPVVDVTSHPELDVKPALETTPEIPVQVEREIVAEALSSVVEPELEAAIEVASVAAEPVMEEVAPIMKEVAPAFDEPLVVVAPVATPEAHNANVARAVANIQYNFNLSREDRETWAEGEYIDCIRRIDVAQAEAFFLKGKLLGEVKDRFYLENKVGWKTFSENSLGMNYTTVNQYIRVSAEFDVASHRRPDFGFEHYKALLPLKVDDRVKLLGELPQVSVKELRNIVQRKLMEEGAPAPRLQRTTLQSKELIELLLDLKTKIFDCTPETMDQKERWQLTAACRNLADDLATVATHLNSFGKRASETSPRTVDVSGEVGV